MSNREIDEKLYEAAMEGDIAEMKNCLARGANPNARTEYSHRVIIADTSVDVPALEVLIEAGAKVNLRNEYGYFPSHERQFSSEDVQNTLIKAGAISWFDINGLCDNIRNVEDMKKLLNSGIEITIDNKGHESNSPLLCQACRDFEGIDLKESSFEFYNEDNRRRADNYINFIDLYIEAGGNINATDANGCTALMYSKSAFITDILLERGADANAVDNEGHTAADYAVANMKMTYDDGLPFYPESASILTLLAEYGCKPAIKNYPLGKWNEILTSLYQFEIAELPESAFAKLKENFVGEHGNHIYYEYDEEFNKFSKIKGRYDEASGYEDRETETVARVIEQDENKFSLYTDGGYILIEKGKDGGSIVTVENCLANAEILQAGGLTYVPDTLKGKYENNYDMPFIDIDDFAKLRGRYLDKLRKHIDTPDSIAEYAKARRAYDAETGVARKLWYDTNFFFKNENPMDDMVSISKVEKVKKEKASDVRIAEKQKKVQQWKTEQAKKPNLNIIKNSIQREY